MKRCLLAVAVVAFAACRHPSGPADEVAPPPVAATTAATPPPVAAATAPPTSTHLVTATTGAPVVLPASATPAQRVQGILPRWIELLERGDDESFIDEAVVPEELAKVLGGKSKAELVSTFRDDKHQRVLETLHAIVGAAPTKSREEGERTFVTYDLRGEKAVTFVVVGSNVYIKN